MSCLEIIAWTIVVKEDTNTQIFEYGAEYGAECNVESVAKWYSIFLCQVKL